MRQLGMDEHMSVMRHAALVEDFMSIRMISANAPAGQTYTINRIGFNRALTTRKIALEPKLLSIQLPKGWTHEQAGKLLADTLRSTFDPPFNKKLACIIAVWRHSMFIEEKVEGDVLRFEAAHALEA